MKRSFQKHQKSDMGFKTAHHFCVWVARMFDNTVTTVPDCYYTLLSANESLFAASVLPDISALCRSASSRADKSSASLPLDRRVRLLPFFEPFLPKRADSGPPPPWEQEKSRLMTPSHAHVIMCSQS